MIRTALRYSASVLLLMILLGSFVLPGQARSVAEPDVAKKALIPIAAIQQSATATLPPTSAIRPLLEKADAYFETMFLSLRQAKMRLNFTSKS